MCINRCTEDAFFFFRSKVSEVIMKMQKSCELSMGNWIWFPAQIDNLCINEYLKEWIYITIPTSIYFALLFYINVKIYFILLYYLVVIIVVYYFA